MKMLHWKGDLFRELEEMLADPSKGVMCEAILVVRLLTLRSLMMQLKYLDMWTFLKSLTGKRGRLTLRPGRSIVDKEPFHKQYCK